MGIGGKLLLTSIIFIIVGGLLASFGEDQDEDWAMMIGVCIVLLFVLVFIAALLIMIWW